MATKCCARVEEKLGDFDTVFSYTTPRMVMIKDRRLGLMMLFVQVAVFLYVIVYQILILQAYKRPGAVAGSVRMRLQAPSSAYR